MTWEDQQELRRLEEKLNGVTVAVEKGFEGIRKDIHYLSRVYTPVIVLAITALIISLLALIISLDNRALILKNVQIEQRD